MPWGKLVIKCPRKQGVLWKSRGLSPGLSQTSKARTDFLGGCAKICCTPQELFPPPLEKLAPPLSPKNEMLIELNDNNMIEIRS